jgi:2-dehydro-3-deoxyphosphogluconate aldolase/(4S)-4-hydroxy-2-oxoglutarate aldolase
MSLPWRTPVLPVVTLDRVDDAVPVARALLRGGIDAIEIVLRTAAALDAVRALRAEVEAICVGVGSLLSPADVARAGEAGAQFLVTPGATDRLLDALGASGLPSLPGTATASDMVRVLDHGMTHAKLFPAVACGGVEFLRAVAGPIPQLSFCPTGGITEATAPDFLALANVSCVGGSWLVPTARVAARDWPAIEAMAARAARLGA